MAASLNRVTLIGNLGKDPEIRSMNNGNRVASFSLAVSESWKDRSGERREKTEWIPVVIFSDGLVGVVEQYLRKGSKCLVEGKFQTRKWQDQSGADRYMTEVVVQQFGGTLILLDGKRQDSEPARHQETAGEYDQSPLPSSDLDDEIPF
jgi:single-strand DNA-binding protein